MPHALFLGSSLAGIDRLNILPTPPIHPSEQPTSHLVRNARARLRRRMGKERANEMNGINGEDIELHLRPVPTLTGLAGPSVRVPPNGSTAFATDDLPASAGAEEGQKGKDVFTERASSGEGSLADGEEEYRKAMTQYTAEMSKFDRIRWVTLHLWHAWVRSYFTPTFIL